MCPRPQNVDHRILGLLLFFGRLSQPKTQAVALNAVPVNSDWQPTARLDINTPLHARVNDLPLLNRPMVVTLRSESNVHPPC